MNRYTIGITAALCLAIGCQSGPRLASLNPFKRSERIAIATPNQRADEIRRLAKESTGQDTPEQREVVAGLVGELKAEADPLLREAMLETLAAFDTPLAVESIRAGLNDQDPFVRRTCCRLLGEKPSESSTEQLARVLREDADFDVRVAAAKALGESPGSRPLLVAALEDRDPALQYVGVEAMKQITGEDYGGDVAAYLALAKGETPSAASEEPAVSVARGLSGWIPFF